MSIFHPCFRIKLCHSRRYASTVVNFSNFLQQRRNQAQKSILVQVSGLNSAPELQSYLTSEFGPLEAAFHYALPGNKAKQGSGGSAGALSPPQGGHVHWILAEFSKQSDFDKAIHSCRNAVGTLPFVSSMCWFSQKAAGAKSISNKGIAPVVSTENLTKCPDHIDFSKAKSLSEQILVLEKAVKITELGVRVRFLVANHLEQSMEKFFPGGCILPFGSTVSGIGRRSGDLDLVLLPDKSEIFPKQGLPAAGPNSRLWHQTKLYSNSPNSRFQVQRVMETVADVIQLFVPGCTQVQRILQARVPILRFWSEYTDLQCDLSMTNSSGIHMSELIYLMTVLDSRFTSLLFAIRSWAAARKITNPVPGKQPTNFILVLLLIYFCQFKKILPTFDILYNNAGKADARVTADGIDCTFLRDPAKIRKYFTPQNQSSSLAELLYEFFEFYSEFDFTSKGISLFTGTAWGKPDAGPMYIQNPIERHLNVARNVSKEEIARLKSECCTALWKLEEDASEGNEVRKKKIQLLTLNDLLAPQLQNISTASISPQALKMKDLLID